MATVPADYRVLPEPETEPLRRWFRPILEHGSTFCAPNLQTEFAFLRTPTMELPITINETEWDNSRICSPWNQLASLKIFFFRNPWIRRGWPPDSEYNFFTSSRCSATHGAKRLRPFFV